MFKLFVQLPVYRLGLSGALHHNLINRFWRLRLFAISHRLKGRGLLLGVMLRALICVLALACSVPALCAALPAACGDERATLRVELQKDTHALTDHLLPDPTPGKAELVFIEDADFRQSCFLCSIATRVGIDGRWVGANQGNSYFAIAVAPGEHHLCTDWQSTDRDLKGEIGLGEIKAEAGQIYFYRVRITRIGYGLELVPVDMQEGSFRLRSATLSIATPPPRQGQ